MPARILSARLRLSGVLLVLALAGLGITAIAASAAAVLVRLLRYMRYVVSRFGRTLPRTPQTQYNAVPHIAKTSAMPGDLIFSAPPRPGSTTSGCTQRRARSGLRQVAGRR